MTSSFVWVLRRVLYTYCVPSKARKHTQPVSVTALSPSHPPPPTAYQLTPTQEGVHLLTPWTEEETEAQEAA